MRRRNGMGKTISVSSFAEIAAVSAKLKGFSENYDSIAKRLMMEAQTMGAAWEGADNEAFVRQITGFTDDLKRMSEKLMSASAALKRQHDNYVNRQNDNIAQAARLEN